ASRDPTVSLLRLYPACDPVPTRIGQYTEPCSGPLGPKVPCLEVLCSGMGVVPWALLTAPGDIHPSSVAPETSVNAVARCVERHGSNTQYRGCRRHSHKAHGMLSCGERAKYWKADA